jgi:hypothetical protein
MMRRVCGLVLAAAGAFLLLTAVLLPTYIADQVIRFPLNVYESVTLTATDARYFSSIALKEFTAADIQATETIKGDPAVGDASIAVWDEFSYLYDTTHKLPVYATSRAFALDRRSAELVNCCGENIDGDSAVSQSGLAGYVFPFGTRKQTYQVFDVTLERPEPFTYSGSDTVDGVAAYKFTENISPTQVGFSQLSATEPEYYSVHLTYWIDPVTGALLQVRQDEDEYLVNPVTKATVTTLFDADLVTTPAAVRGLVRLDDPARKRIALLRTTLPLVFGIGGVVAVIAGFLLGRGPGQRAQSSASLPPPEPAPADQTPAQHSWFEPSSRNGARRPQDDGHPGRQ